MSEKNVSVVFPGLPDVQGQTLLDVGCGEGTEVRLFAGADAKATGLDVSAEMLARARAEATIAGERYVEGSAEDLPFDDGEFDLVVFYNSLHHVEVAKQPVALSEAARVVKAGGMVYVSEPMSEGPLFELSKPIDDETVVLAHAYEAVQGAGAAGLTEIDETSYERVVHYTNYEAFRERMIRIDPVNRSGFEATDAELGAAFTRLGRKRNGEYEFIQPNRVNVLKKA